MIDGSAVLGLIPARGGSKAIPRKNVAPLAGRPLLAYTVEAALAAKRLGRVLLSTDDPEIAAVGRSLGLEVPFLRPPELARDEAPMLPVMRHALDWARGEGLEVEAVALLQPTSPMRESRHIDEAIELMERAGAETVVSVVEVPHRFNPVSILTMKDGVLSPFRPGPELLRRQDKPRVFARNGPAILIVRSAVLGRGALYGNPSVGYVMDERDSLDIDDPWDLRLAELLIAARRHARHA
ncbi:MAG: acylneuraminate cytidylyltransferase family protein [Pseudomonadota bacterium]